MGPKLVPAVQVQSMIWALVESGAVDGEAAGQWKEVDEMRTKANNGNPGAMFELSDWCYGGSNGLVQDLELSYSWVEKSANLGNIRAKAAGVTCSTQGRGRGRGAQRVPFISDSRQLKGLVLCGILYCRSSLPRRKCERVIF